MRGGKKPLALLADPGDTELLKDGDPRESLANDAVGRALARGTCMSKAHKLESIEDLYLKWNPQRNNYSATCRRCDNERGARRKRIKRSLLQ